MDALDEALAAHEVFRRMGFSPDDIYLLPSHPSGKDTTFVQVVLRAQGLQFVYGAGFIEVPFDDIQVEWGRRIDRWNRAKDDKSYRTRIFDDSRIRQDVVNLMMAMVDKGFSLSDPGFDA